MSLRTQYVFNYFSLQIRIVHNKVVCSRQILNSIIICHLHTSVDYEKYHVGNIIVLILSNQCLEQSHLMTQKRACLKVKGPYLYGISKCIRVFTRKGNKINNIKPLSLELSEDGLECVVWSRNIVVRTTQACTSGVSSA